MKPAGRHGRASDPPGPGIRATGEETPRGPEIRSALPSSVRQRRRRFLVEWGLHLPSLAWLAVFFLVPLVWVVVMAFRPPDPYGGAGEGWTLQNLRELFQASYLVIAWRTLWLSAAATGICLLLGIPAGYYLARSPRRWRPTLVLLVVIPFWTNFLIRVFAWKVLLHPEGLLKRGLVALHLAEPEASLLYRPEAVLLVLVYTYLPFAILPIYAAAERFDFQLMEAALDLGCHRFHAFVRVLLPGIRRGLATAALVVFVPALGSYVIPDLVGGPAAEMIGNKITQRMLSDRNLPAAAALSSALTIAVVLPMLWALYLRREEARAGGSAYRRVGERGATGCT